ncbi:MAG: VWA domain-containing protein [Cyclobacteriaceae bacterium]
MTSPNLLFELSPWYIFVCILMGAGYAFLLYSKKGPWGALANKVLTGLRLIVVSVLCVLLLGPFLKQIFNTTENPTFIVAVDNSTSVLEGMDTTAFKAHLGKLSVMGQQLEENDYEVVYQTLSDKTLLSLNDVSIDQKSTNLNDLFRSIQSDYEGRNLGGVLLVSDGIYNQGLSPTFSNYNFKIHTLGLGDTIPKKDISLKNVFYNKIAYQGNRFPLVAEVSNSGFGEREVIVRVSKKGSEIARQGVRFTSDNQLRQVSFLLDADLNGIQHYRVEVLPLEGETTLVNNFKDAYLEVIEGREKILIIGQAPHPDMKAIVSSLETNPNYEIVTHLPRIDDFKEDKYDLVIVHQAFDRYNRTTALIKKFRDEGTPLWLIVGNQTNYNNFNELNGLVQLTVSRNQKDLVRPAFNRSFNRFKVETENATGLISNYPPAVVPFGKTELLQGAEVFLYQQVGSIVTDKPLIAVFDNAGSKTAVMMGEGFWQWRTMEFAKTGKQEVFDEMISKMVQFLSAKEDKRKFRVYTKDDEYFDSEEVVFETEAYNDIYEPIYGQEIQLTISNESGEAQEFSYVTSNANSQFKVSGLANGIYSFSASTLLNGKKETASGEFLVKELQIESINLTANHQLLKRLSRDTDGSFATIGQMDDLQSDLLGMEAQGVIYTSESFLPLINLKWPFFLLLLLISVEWFIRKYSGAY